VAGVDQREPQLKVQDAAGHQSNPSVIIPSRTWPYPISRTLTKTPTKRIRMNIVDQLQQRLESDPFTTRFWDSRWSTPSHPSAIAPTAGAIAGASPAAVFR
jgi:hypothetical protein